jgi:HEAT repeat protein
MAVIIFLSGILTRMRVITILEPPLLTYAAEYLGEIENEGLAERVVETLLRLTENSSALVREGAIYGLEDYLDRPNVAERLTTIATTDPSAGVRAAAQEALEA